MARDSDRRIGVRPEQREPGRIEVGAGDRALLDGVEERVHPGRAREQGLGGRRAEPGAHPGPDAEQDPRHARVVEARQGLDRLGLHGRRLSRGQELGQRAFDFGQAGEPQASGRRRSGRRPASLRPSRSCGRRRAGRRGSHGSGRPRRRPAVPAPRGSRRPSRPGRCRATRSDSSARGPSSVARMAARASGRSDTPVCPTRAVRKARPWAEARKPASPASRVKTSPVQAVTELRIAIRIQGSDASRSARAARGVAARWPGSAPERERELVADPRVGVAGQGRHPARDAFVLAAERLPKPQGVGADARVGIAERGQDVARLDRPQARQRGRRMGPADGRIRSGRELPQGGDGGPILPLIQQSRGGVAMPAIRVFEQGDQLGRRRLAQPGDAGSMPVGHDPPDPAAIDAAGYVHVLEDLGRQEGGASISSRHMSTTQRQPSGALASCTGRK